MAKAHPNSALGQSILIIPRLIVFVFMSSFCFSSVAAECCRGQGAVIWYRGTCGDGSTGHPCCGVGACNFACCNCEGGCLRPAPPTTTKPTTTTTTTITTTSTEPTTTRTTTTKPTTTTTPNSTTTTLTPVPHGGGDGSGKTGFIVGAVCFILVLIAVGAACVYARSRRRNGLGVCPSCCCATGEEGAHYRSLVNDSN